MTFIGLCLHTFILTLDNLSGIDLLLTPHYSSSFSLSVHMGSYADLFWAYSPKSHDD